MQCTVEYTLFLDVSAALLHIVHCNYANTLILVEILVVLMCLFNMKIVLTFASKKTLNYVYRTQASAKYTA